MNVVEIIEIWADDFGLDLLWGHDDEDTADQHFIEVHGGRDYQRAIDDLDFVLNRIGYVVDMAYDYKGGVRIEIARN